MPHVITQPCCSDASCVYACPVNCIHPTPDEPGFATAEMLYIDPSTCVDCGACITACPVGAISPGHRIPDTQERFTQVNADYYGADPDPEGPRFPVDSLWRKPLAPVDKPRALDGVPDPLQIAIVGSGPSAMYAADELLKHRQVRVTMFERLSEPFGLARFGVAPDHPATRSVVDLFNVIAQDPYLQILLNTEVGRDVTLEQLRQEYHAVLWAGGAPTDRPLEITGVDLPGVQSATTVVGWYNGHPDFVDAVPLLDTERAVVIGNGNVALDVARILTADPDRLATTNIDAAALAHLRGSSIREIVVVGRRGAEHGAFTLPELIGLADGPAHVWVDPADLVDAPETEKTTLLREISQRPKPAEPYLRLAFGLTPERILGEERATGVRFQRTGTQETVELQAGAVFTAIGYRGRPVPGLPFDDARGTIANVAGRITADQQPIPGLYVTGWVKRGPNGFIGTNKTDSAEAVRGLLADAEAGLLARAGV
ncbi:putative ferredoxin--NADP(+) reductase [Gordonia hirsuta DSM 44140 = NBRC 16056]|uniref:ferredoxin--NADP(+) reductase n=1 Tax=Gordonia hirsuta DSM 44140 = NBRC 16056 TaxID=1121927 RepID=L7L938_9ACTN|nr:FAD-dependent oxidoreductase [Gordonia hirsuta]GAC57439.1 putative ferredoxin--NADP(+) reductase [Gordonia hirsuta DSM 44140 = NBRC 16056]